MNENIFLVPEQIAETVFTEMTGAEIFFISTLLNAEDMIMYHNNVGRMIRNRFELWHDDNPHLNGKDPDDISHEILKMVWEKVNENLG